MEGEWDRGDRQTAEVFLRDVDHEDRAARQEWSRLLGFAGGPMVNKELTWAEGVGVLL